MIHGIFSTMEENAFSKEIFNAVRRLLNKQFTKVRGWYFGDEAMSLNGKVRYVCIGTNEPEEYDFHLYQSDDRRSDRISDSRDFGGEIILS